MGNFGEKPFVWKIFLGGDTSKKRIKTFNTEKPPWGSSSPRITELVSSLTKFVIFNNILLQAVFKRSFLVGNLTGWDLRAKNDTSKGKMDEFDYGKEESPFTVPAPPPSPVRGEHSIHWGHRHTDSNLRHLPATHTHTHTEK